MTRRTFVSAALLPLAMAQAEPPRRRRAESFFGLHFDLHPTPADPALGRDVTEAMVEKILDAARPDFVQYDSKGHPGWLAWPASQAGPSAPHIVNDSLAIWRKVTARRGVALYIHFSGVYDSQAVTLHPDWARVDEKGRRDERYTSTFGPYVDEMMIPELREAATRYALDGAWVDGECWAVMPDYSPRALAAWKQATGYERAPANAKEAHWVEWLDFQREQFRRYVRHYVDALHASHPSIQIASNWIYSTRVPEKPVLPVDFLSGDYSPNLAVASARPEARFLAQQGKPWDLMAWGFQTGRPPEAGHSPKPAVQLQQEASVVLAQGGGFQVYYSPTREGHVDDSTIEVIRKVAAFCREREAFSHRSETVPQAGVVYSKTSAYRNGDGVFGFSSELAAANGWLDLLLDSQYSSDVIPEWRLAEAGGYGLLVLPEYESAADETFSTLRAYAERGGLVLVSGAVNCARWLGIAREGKAQPAFVMGEEGFAGVGGAWLDLEAGGAMKRIETRHASMDSTRPGQPAALSVPAGRGEVVLVPGPLGALYQRAHVRTVAQFARRLIRPRFTPLVEVEGPSTLEVVLRRKNGKLYVHLLNLTAMQESERYATSDFVPEVGPVSVRFRKQEPRSVRLLPEGRELRAPYRIERLHLHATLEVA